MKIQVCESLFSILGLRGQSRWALMSIDHYLKTSLVQVHYIVLMFFCGPCGILTWKRPLCWSLHSHRLSYPPQLGSGQPMKQMVEATKTEKEASVLVSSGNSKPSVKPALNNRHLKFWTQVTPPIVAHRYPIFLFFFGY